MPAGAPPARRTAACAAPARRAGSGCWPRCSRAGADCALLARSHLRARRPARLRAGARRQHRGPGPAARSLDADELLYDLLLDRRGHDAAVHAGPQLLRRQPRRGRRAARPPAHASPASATAAPTSAPSATPASRPPCSPTGAGTGARGSGSTCPWWSARSAGPRPRPSACSTAACWRPATRPTSTSSTSTASASSRRRIAYDLPAGGKRLLQSAAGYLHTIVSGTETYRDGQPTGDLPGRLVRGPQAEPGNPG